MISSRRPPTFIPAMPWSQPGITSPPPRVKVNGSPRLPGGVEFFARVVAGADVLDGDFVAGFGFGAVAFDQVLRFQLLRRRARSERSPSASVVQVLGWPASLSAVVAFARRLGRGGIVAAAAAAGHRQRQQRAERDRSEASPASGGHPTQPPRSSLPLSPCRRGGPRCDRWHRGRTAGEVGRVDRDRAGVRARASAGSRRRRRRSSARRRVRRSRPTSGASTKRWPPGPAVVSKMIPSNMSRLGAERTRTTRPSFSPSLEKTGTPLLDDEVGARLPEIVHPASLARRRWPALRLARAGDTQREWSSMDQPGIDRHRERRAGAGNARRAPRRRGADLRRARRAQRPPGGAAGRAGARARATGSG